MSILNAVCGCDKMCCWQCGCGHEECCGDLECAHNEQASPELDIPSKSD